MSERIFMTNNSGYVITQPQPQNNLVELRREVLRLQRLLGQVQEVKPSGLVSNSGALVQIPMGQIR